MNRGRALPRSYRPKEVGNLALPSNMVGMVCMVFQPLEKDPLFPGGCRTMQTMRTMFLEG